MLSLACKKRIPLFYLFTSSKRLSLPDLEKRLKKQNAGRKKESSFYLVGKEFFGRILWRRGGIEVAVRCQEVDRIRSSINDAGTMCSCGIGVKAMASSCLGVLGEVRRLRSLFELSFLREVLGHLGGTCKGVSKMNFLNNPSPISYL
jgi:hypothetical protein